MDQVSQANSRQKCKYKSKKVGLVYTRPLAREINKGLTEVFCYSTSNMVIRLNYMCNGKMFDFYSRLPHIIQIEAIFIGVLTFVAKS